MANKQISMNKVRQVLRLYTQGKTKSNIAEKTGIARNTVRKYIKIFIDSQHPFDEINELKDKELNELFNCYENPETPEKLKVLNSLFPKIDKELKRKGVTKESIWTEYIRDYPDGYRFTQFRKYLNLWRKQVNPTMHIEHKAGDKMYVDFAGETLEITDIKTGVITSVEVFVAILGASQLAYVEPRESQKKEDFIIACENAMCYFGGVPLAIVPDNLKSAVTKSDRYEPTLNETFDYFSEHYSTTILAARAYKPRDKALAEGMVKIVYRKIYAMIRDMTFFSIDELRNTIKERLEILNNSQMKGRDYSRRQQFEEIERSALQPLPEHQFEFKKQQMATVMKNGHVFLGIDKHYYSVDSEHIGKRVKIIFSNSRVEIFSNYECIAEHERVRIKYGYTTKPEHMASTHRFVSEWNPERFINWAASYGPYVKGLIELILQKKAHPEQGYKSCLGILTLEKKVGKDRLINACRRALEYGIYNYKIVQNILEKGLDKQNPTDENDDRKLPPHDNIRGNDYYE